jgi:pyridoxal phosphate enzyme (YggS family)
MSVQENIHYFNQRLEGTGCKLIAVSKTYPPERILEAYQAGQRLFGENRVQELVPKYEALPKDIKWHLIGHLQSNKVKYIAPFVSLIHSVDSLKLLEEINRQALKVGRVIDCLLQVYIAQEETKFGLDYQEVRQLLAHPTLAQLKNIRLVGLMGMASNTPDLEQVRQEFRGLRSFFEQLRKQSLPSNVGPEVLSMGMSGDWEIALEEGSTLIRAGSAVFGKRNSTLSSFNT